MLQLLVAPSSLSTPPRESDPSSLTSLPNTVQRAPAPSKLRMLARLIIIMHEHSVDGIPQRGEREGKDSSGDSQVNYYLVQVRVESRESNKASIHVYQYILFRMINIREPGHRVKQSARFLSALDCRHHQQFFNLPEGRGVSRHDFWRVRQMFGNFRAQFTIKVGHFSFQLPSFPYIFYCPV